MTLASNLVSLAYREANFTAVGSDPTADELVEGLTMLQGLVDSLFGLIVGTKLRPWWVPLPQRTSSKAAQYPAQYGEDGLATGNDISHPPANARLMMKNTAAQTIYFQYQPQDGAIMDYVDVGHTANVTLDANGALFGLTGGDTQVVMTSDFPTNRNAPRRWIYRADVGSWVEIERLALDEELPFPTWFDDYFVTALCMRLTPRQGADPRQATMLRYREMVTLIRAQYAQMGIDVGNITTGGPAEQAWDGGGQWAGDGFVTGNPY